LGDGEGQIVRRGTNTVERKGEDGPVMHPKRYRRGHGEFKYSSKTGKKGQK